MTEASQPEPSYLFTLRVWHEHLGNGQVEWRGQIRHVLTGQVHYFRGWSALAEHLRTMLETGETRDEPGKLAGESAAVHAPGSDNETKAQFS